MKEEVPPPKAPLDMKNGRSSPIDSPALGAALMGLLATDNDSMSSEEDLKAIKNAVEVAISQTRLVDFRDRKMGVDEVLNGRAGLLWALLEIYQQQPSDHIQNYLREVIPILTDVIIRAGRDGADTHCVNANETCMPLMWSWIDQYHSLGA